ncbi:MAG: hypothetical protein UHY68_07355 [Acutalibacteraceae bacterium]|nr:hypothetical protein [Acutalibacteraceae bacterium]
MKKDLGIRTKSKIVDVLSKKTLWFFGVSICFAIMYALIITKNSDFYPINGDFQNYNPARRFLDGQIPFKDFSVYLGCGEMILDSLGLLVIGNTFTNSLMVIRFFNAIIFYVFTYVISYLISASHKFSSLLSALSLGIVSVSKLFIYSTILESGNSARLIRCGILAVELALILAAINVIWKRDIPKNKKLIFTSIAVGLITGSGIIWSNDYGIACAICISLCYAIAGIKIVHKFGTVILNVGVYILSAITGFLLSVFIITRGNVGSYFSSIFSTGTFQKWYYKIDDSSIYDNYRIFDFEFDIIYLFGLILLIYAFVCLFKAKTLTDIFKNSLSASIFLTALFASEFYHIVSGTSSTKGLSIVVVLYAIVYTLFIAIQFIRRKNLLSKFRKIRFLKKNTLELLSLGLCVCIFLFQVAYKIYYTPQNENYGKYLGNDIDGNLSETLATPILNASEIIGDEEVFSTYASATEVYCGKFQPTGFDYIIHVLGDENRQAYLDTFKNGNYKYAMTINTEFDGHEYWIKNSNWFFYRQLCTEYIPTYDNSQWVIWRKSENDTKTYDLSKAKLKIKKIDDASVKLIIEYDEKISGTADVSLSYDTEYNKSFFKTGNINKFIMINSTTEKEAVNMLGKSVNELYFNFCLPEESDCYYVPVTIKDGYGELLITSKPDDDVKLTINSVKINKIFDFDYIEGNLIKE